VGETPFHNQGVGGLPVLSVSSNGSEWVKPPAADDAARDPRAFSILKRIGVGETIAIQRLGARLEQLSVSSNGSEWVKHRRAFWP